MTWKQTTGDPFWDPADLDGPQTTKEIGDDNHRIRESHATNHLGRFKPGDQVRWSHLRLRRLGPGCTKEANQIGHVLDIPNPDVAQATIEWGDGTEPMLVAFSNLSPAVRYDD